MTSVANPAVSASFPPFRRVADLLREHAQQRPQASALADAQQAAQRAARQERAAAQLCARMHGNAGYRWSEDGTLVCTDHRGRVSVTVAGGPRP